MQPEAHAAAGPILVVDDNEGNRALAQAALEDEGYRVILATNGAEGLAAFQQHQPACVLLDIRMPGMDGVAVCERIRALPEGANTPVLFLTAQRDIDSFDRALKAGGDDFLTKPILPTELVTRVGTAVRLRNANAALRDHLELAKQQRDGLLRMQLQRERMTAFVVHDLKTPVNTMMLLVQLLLREKGLPEAAQAHATEIRAAVKRLDAMIANLLDISKADEGRLTPKLSELDLPTLVDDGLAELVPQALTRNVRLESSVTSARILLDRDLFRRTIVNLVENSIRYAPPGTCVTVSARREGTATEIRIADRGPGVPAHLRERLFDPFEQAEAPNRVLPHSSRGLGLTFCKRVIEAHGGRIWIEDGNPGAVFCVSLPDNVEPTSIEFSSSVGRA
jgi:two-component system, sensor histidine kinase and response regulator